MHEQQYRVNGRYQRSVMLVPALIAVLLIGGAIVPGVWFVGSIVIGLGATYLVRLSRLAHAITVHADGRIELRRLFDSMSVHPLEVQSIGLGGPLYRPFLKMRTTKGTVLLSNEWAGFPDFVGYLRKGNPQIVLHRT